MTNDELTKRLKEVRNLDDPRTNPSWPYTAQYIHLAVQWPVQVEKPNRYRILWKEDRPDGVAVREGSTQLLICARLLAQGRSLHDRTVAGLAWVQLLRDEEEPTTVDVWERGYWVEPHGTERTAEIPQP